MYVGGIHMGKLNQLFSRLLSLLLLLSMVLGMIPFTVSTMSTKVSAAEPWDVDGDGTLSILCIGNSFSSDAMQYIPQIIDSLGITTIYLGNLYIGGCSLATHWTNANGDLAKYDYYTATNTSGSWGKKTSQKISTALKSRSWDYISMQQRSQDSGLASTYNSNLTNLVNYVKNNAPNAKLIWHMTWAYQGNSNHAGFSNYSNNQTTMYNGIVNAVKTKVVTNANINIIVPNGTAIQNARSSLIRDFLCRDGYHLNYNIGRYIAGLTFVKALGIDISNVTFKPANVPEIWQIIAKESATNAVSNPYAKTTSAHTNPANEPDHYKLLTVDYTHNAYWHSTKEGNYNTLYKPSSSEATYREFYGSNKRFTASTIPVGSVIILTSGYKYRPEAWVSNKIQTSREGATTVAHTAVTDEWWKNKDGTSFLYRAFNVSLSSGAQIASGLDIDNNILKIYVPKTDAVVTKTPEELYSYITNLPDPIPNNHRVTWTNVSDIPNISGKKYIVVSDASTTGNKYYAWDPITPRLFETWNAASVSVNSTSGTSRVYDAGENWGIKFTYDATFDYKQAGYTDSNLPAAQRWFSFKFEVPENELDSTKVYLTNEVNYSSSTGYASSLAANVWRLQNTAFYTSLPEHKNSSGTVKTTTTWSKRNARAHLYFNINSDRFNFIWWPQFRDEPVAIGDKTQRTSVRSQFNNPSTEDPYFYFDTSKEYANTTNNAVNYACFFLFEVENRGNPEELYDKLKEAQKYINVEYTYYPTQYTDFLKALGEVYDFYINNNGSGGTQAEFDAQETKLQNAMTALNAYNQIQYLGIPYNKRVYKDNLADYQNGKLEGTYFISRFYNGNKGRVHSFIDFNNLTSAGAYGIHRYREIGGQMNATDLTHAITLRYVKGTSEGYTMQLENRNFFRSSGTKFTTMGEPQTFYFGPSDYTGMTGGIQIDNVDGKRLFCEAQTSFKWYFATVGAEQENRGDFHLWQLSPTTLELYRALKFIQPYCNQTEAVNRYPADLYREFITFMSSAIKAYNDCNNNNYFSNATKKAELENIAKQVREWADKLTQTDQTLSYIDIPIEVFDFKADGMMFEHDNSGTNYYGLSASAASVSPALPGSSGTGLIEPQLVDGNPVYKQQTIDYVASAIMLDKGASNQPITNLINCGADYNETFRNKMKNITKGSWDLTLQKIGGKNGGDLAWSNVETAYDLAYYALTYIWREVPTTDANKLSDGDRYNIRVPEREIIRLYRTSNSGYYTFFSDNNTAYSGNRLYNTFPTIANPTALPQYADFMPVDGLGFETGGKNTDTGTNYANNGSIDKLATDNFHYSMHAYGSFVYYEDQELFFEFIGDDDVYFFINNTLVLDIGGSHSPLGGTVNLKDVTLADGTKLVDEQIYSFDMYYAERHTTGSNMKFSTNIKIVDTDTFTTKGQYIEISGDDDMVNKATGMGSEILDNGLVKVGDTIAYSFNVVNSHDVSATDLIFEDETLGTYISKNIISLTNEERTNIVTDITDIEVYYHTSEKVGESFVIDNTIPVVKTVDQIKAMIEEVNAANEIEPGNSLPEGSYRVTMTSEQDLMDLLGLGVPSNCQIVIYGFKRLFVEGDQNKTIKNELKMACSYLPWASGDTELNVRALTGTAGRILKVASLSGIPSAIKTECVIDYGKPLSIDCNGTITMADGVTINGFVGFTKNGYHGEFLKSKPADLANSIHTKNGRFDYRLGTVYYTLFNMLSEVESVYAVFSLSGCTITDTAGKARNYPYILAEINIVPATTVYYETDFDTIDFVGDNSAYTMIGLEGKQSPHAIIDFESNDTTTWSTYHTTATKADGVLKGSIIGDDPRLPMNTGSVNYTVASGDVVKLRMKIDKGTGSNVEVFFLTNKNTTYSGTYMTNPTSYTPDGEWSIVTLPINSNTVGTTISQIRIDPLVNYTTTGNYEIDWVYIGPDNDDTAWTGANKMTATLADGVLKGSVTGGDPFVRMTCASSTYNHTITSSDVVKMRIKSDASIGTGAQVFFLTDQNANPVGGIQADNTTYVPNGEWQIITLDINSSAVGRTMMGIRIDPTNTISTDSKTGNYEIDWVYIGPDIPDTDLFACTSTESSIFDTVTHVEDIAFVKFTDSETSFMAINGAVNPETGHFRGQFEEYEVEGIEAKLAHSDILLKNTDLSNYVLREGDILKLRMMVSENEVFEADSVYAEVYAGLDNEDFFEQETMLLSDDGDYYIYTISVPAEMAGRSISEVFIKLDATFIKPEDTTNSDEPSEPEDTPEPVAFEIDWIYVGPDKPLTISHEGVLYPDHWSEWTTDGTSEVSLQTMTKVDESETYGYDAVYADDSTYSNDSTLYVVGAGVPNLVYKTDENGAYVFDQAGKKIYVIDYESVLAYSQTSFTFTGTGFDIISRTGVNQGALRVVVCDMEGNVKKTASVINKGNSELYQIPVVSVEKLDYGTYTVHIFVNSSYTNTDYPVLNRGGEFYFDAVRIYNPINTKSTDADGAYAYSLYQAHGEADPSFTEIRNMLIGPEDVEGSFNAGGELAGVVYLDAKDAEGNDYEITIDNYNAVGPNNEVYLKNGNAIAFKLEVTGEIPTKISIGAKSVGTTPAALLTDVATKAPAVLPSGTATTIATSTEMYYSLNISEWLIEGDKSYAYVTVANTGDGLLSLTNIKLSYAAEPATNAKSIRFVFDAAMREALGMQAEHTYTYINNGENHTVGCAGCDFSETVDHTYVDGICVCGAVEIVEPSSVFVEGLKPIMAITVGADMSVAYTIPNELISQYDKFYLEVEKEYADKESVKITYNLEDLQAVPNFDTPVLYNALFKGINAKEMGDRITATLYGIGEDGTIYYGPTVADSIKDYLMRGLDLTTTTDAKKTMYVDMLNYGAVAQAYMGYNAQNPVNKDLAERHLAYATTTLPEANDLSDINGNGYELSANVQLLSRVTLTMTAILPEANVENMKYVISDALTDEVITELPVTIKNNIVCTGSFDNVGAKQMRRLLKITLFDGDIAISRSITWSIESYVAQTRTTTDLAKIDLVNALLAYGDSVAAYMAE